MSFRAWTLAALLVVSTSVALAQAPPPPPQGGGRSAEAKAILEACKADIAQFCGQVAPGQGRIKACMKEHLRELSEPCKEALFQAWLHD